MKLEQLYINFAELSEREQLGFLRNYRNKRFMDLQSYKLETSGNPKKRKVSKVKKKAMPAVSQSDLDILKKLGLSAKDISKMRK